MKHESDIFDRRDGAAEDAAIARARADVVAGRTYPHAIVGEWLKTWGSPGYRPFQEWLAARDG